MCTDNFKEIRIKQVFKLFFSFNQIMLNISRGYYRSLGSGSSRIVFDMGNGNVIKMAKNDAGIAQNISEYKISSIDHSKLFAKVIQASKDFKILIMEKAEKINNISYILYYFDFKNKSEMLKSKKLQKIRSNYNLLLGDLYKKSSWGIINGRPVIVDYGFTKEVMERYY